MGPAWAENPWREVCGEIFCPRAGIPGPAWAKNGTFSKKVTSDLEKKSAPGRLSRPRDPSRSTRAAILADKGVLGVSNR